MIPENIRKLLKEGRTIFLATSSKSAIPNLVAVESCGLVDNKILIADCHLGKTLANLKENDNVSILTTDNKEYFQIKGVAEYQIKGKHFDKILKELEGTEYKLRGIVLISCNEIYDLQRYSRLL
jgi:predicted pyridoxine 5'-phosphate oxidase superfamily flavin-nucleotide-binding protein